MYDYNPEAIKPEKMLNILDKQKKICCKIKSKSLGTGFFCKLFLPNSLKILPVLMTCNHVLDEEDIKIGKTIEYSLDNDKIKYSIKIDDSRILYTNNNFDFTIIQLRKKEYPDVDSLLEIDEGILKKNK